jgi:small subunit ribosomal protein S21
MINPRNEYGVFVFRRESESIESMIKRFKKKVSKSEILKDARKKMEYLKPSVAKKKKKQEAQRRRKKEMEKQEKELVKLKKKDKAEKKRRFAESRLTNTKGEIYEIYPSN